MRRIWVIAAVAMLAGCAGQKPAAINSLDAQQAQVFSTYLSARFAGGTHDMSRAADYYAMAHASDPANPALLAQSFFYAATSGDFEASAKYANAVVTATPNDRAARLALAVIAFKRHDYVDARRQLSLSAKGPFTILTLSLFDAWAAAALHDSAGMNKDLAALAGQKGAESMSAFHTGLLQDYLGNGTAAEVAYRAALSSNAPAPRVLEAYGRFLERHGRSGDAIALYRKHDVQGAMTVVTRPGLARIAAGTIPDALIRTPADGAAEALLGIAASLSDAQSADISILYLRMALYLRPDLDLAQVLLADRFELLHEFATAITIYDAIGVNSPYFRIAQIQSAIDEQRLNKNDAAIARLKKLTAVDPGDSESWIALGDIYRTMNQDAAAVTAYDHAEQAIGVPTKRDWPLFYARAMAREALHKLDESEADIQTALKLSPQQPELLNYLGYSWVDRGRNIPQALTMLEKARSLRPYDGYIVDSVGWAYYRLGRYDDAAKTLEAAVLLVPGDPTINDHFGDALWKVGRHIEARFQWNHALTFSESDTDKAAIENKLKNGLT